MRERFLIVRVSLFLVVVGLASSAIGQCSSDHGFRGCGISDTHATVDLADAFVASLSQARFGFITADSVLNNPYDSEAFSPLEYELDTSIKVLGQTDPVHYRGNLSEAMELAGGNSLTNAAGVINKNADELSDDNKAIILNVKRIEIKDPGNYMGIDVRNGTWAITTRYLSNSSDAWVASLFAHEGQHVRNYQLGRFRGSGMDELWADIRQKQVGRILGLSGYEIEWLNKHITDFTELQNHIDNGYKD